MVFDSDVLIAFMSPEDAHHAEAIEWMRQATQPQTERWISAVNYSELLIAPLRENSRSTSRRCSATSRSTRARLRPRGLRGPGELA